MAEVEQPQLQIPQSISRVSQLPVVKSAWQLASLRYEQLKGLSPMVNSGLTRAEQTVHYMAETSKPVVRKLERPLSIADALVCQGLDKLEEQAPVIKKSPDEVKAVVWDKYGELKGYGSSKVEGLRSYGYGRVNQALGSPYAVAVMKSVDSAIDATNGLVDRYLPAQGDESIQEPSENADVVQRMAFVTEKLRSRMYSQASVQASHLQDQTRKLVVTVQDLMKTLSSVEPSVSGIKDLSEKARKEVSHAIDVIHGLLTNIAQSLQSKAQDNQITNEQSDNSQSAN